MQAGDIKPPKNPLSTTELREITKKIRTLWEEGKLNEDAPKWANFRRDYEAVWSVLLKPDFNPMLLEFMFKTLDDMDSGKISKNTADAAVGYKLAEKYVDPIVSKLPKPES